MSPTRFRAVLQSLRWPPETLASALALKPDEVGAWLDGSKRIPPKVAEWLEGLASAHEAHPHPEGWFERQMSAAAARIVFARKPSRR
jgi:hypothetical protein